MAPLNLITLLTVALGSALTAAAPAAEFGMTSPNLQARSGFLYRFYATSNCNHNNSPSSTYPPNNQGPLQGQTGGQCFNAPLGTNWQRLEIDQPLSNVITFCNINCSGSGSVPQAYYGSHCYVNFPGCAIGSFKVL